MRILLSIGVLVLAGCAGSGEGTTHESVTAPDSTPPPVITPPPPPPATILTWQFHGHLADGGTVEGTVSYDITQPPASEVFTALKERKTYNLTAWNVIVHPSVTPDVTLTFTETEEANTGELCLGHCLFSTSVLERLFLKNDGASLQLVFELPPDNAHDSLPKVIGDWGGFSSDGSVLKGLNPAVFTYVELFMDGVIQPLEAA